MAVFTPVDASTLSQFLLDYDLGGLLAFEGISSGIENTNYFVDTTRGRFVLTLFEKLSRDQLPFYLSLMRHLALKGVACPRPMETRSGSLYADCLGKPAAIATRLSGRDVVAPQLGHCRLVGQALAQSHLAVADFPLAQPNLRGLAWWQATVPALLPHLDRSAATLLEEELHAQLAFAQEALRLPRGAVHADLFRDNVLFATAGQPEDQETPRLGGLIDFYFAGVDSFVFDLAVAVNDWCIDLSAADTGHIDEQRLAALLESYAAIRPLSEAETRAWPMMLRAAALRFWISRLYDWHLPRSAAMLTPKDPSHFERMLRLRRTSHAAAGEPRKASA